MEKKYYEDMQALEEQRRATQQRLASWQIPVGESFERA